MRICILILTLVTSFAYAQNPAEPVEPNVLVTCVTKQVFYTGHPNLVTDKVGQSFVVYTIAKNSSSARDEKGKIVFDDGKRTSEVATKIHSNAHGDFITLYFAQGEPESKSYTLEISPYAKGETVLWQAGSATANSARSAHLDCSVARN